MDHYARIVDRGMVSLTFLVLVASNCDSPKLYFSQVAGSTAMDYHTPRRTLK
jgi:hypothetical protein